MICVPAEKYDNIRNKNLKLDIKNWTNVLYDNKSVDEPQR